jgi:hypothetical protein
MGATSIGDVQRFPIRTDAAVDKVVEVDARAPAVNITPQLEEFMKKICDLVDDHPEWMHQRSPERAKNILSAIRQL